MSDMKQQFCALKEDLKLGLPYISLGLVGFAPAEIPSWGLLSGVIALNYLVKHIQKYNELKPRNKMRYLNILCDHMALTEKGYETDKEAALELNMEEIIPFTLSQEERNDFSNMIRQMYLEKTAYYNISKNIKPMQAAYQALSDIWDKCKFNTDVSDCFRKNRQEEMIALYELKTLYSEIREYDTDEGILMHYNAVHNQLNDEEDFVYSKIAPDLVEKDYLINQSAHSLPVRKNLRGLKLGTVGLTILAGGMTFFGLKQEGVVPERVRYVGGMAATLLAAGFLRGRKHISEEIARFDNDEFIGDIIEYQSVKSSEHETVFSSTVTRLSDAEKLRRELRLYQGYTQKLQNNMTASVKDIENFSYQNIKKHYTTFHLFQQGYNIEDAMRFCSIGGIVEEMCGLSLYRYIGEDTLNNSSTENHLKNIKLIQKDKEDTLAFSQEEEKKENLSSAQKLFLQPRIDDISYISLKREVIVPKNLKIHPYVRELLTQYQNQ